MLIKDCCFSIDLFFTLSIATAMVYSYGMHFRVLFAYMFECCPLC